MKKAKDKNREKTGALSYFLSGTVLCALASALLAVAGFFFFIPYLNIASAVILAPAACIFIRGFLIKRTKLELFPARVLTAGISLAGAYVYVCVVTGVLSAVYGQFPIEAEDLRYTELLEYFRHARPIFTNASIYFAAPRLLWQDLTAWSDGGWPMVAASGVFAQTFLPQIFINTPNKPM
jgi:hypothetical protein